MNARCADLLKKRSPYRSADARLRNTGSGKQGIHVAVLHEHEQGNRADRRRERSGGFGPMLRFGQVRYSLDRLTIDHVPQDGSTITTAVQL
jgi:hypothetical protein